MSAASSTPACDGAAQPCAPAARVRIYEIEKEWGTSMWLCPAGVETMKAGGWRVRAHRAPPFGDLRCYVHQGTTCPN